MLSRVLEKLVLKQLSTYINNHSTLSNNQHAFQKSHSTATALLEVTDQVWKGVDDQKVTTSIPLDLSKAFDKVNHFTFIDISKRYGLYSDWFLSYISGRSEAVPQDNSKSTFLPATNGVSQRNCLGPASFSIYRNELR